MLEIELDNNNKEEFDSAYEKRVNSRVEISIKI